LYNNNQFRMNVKIGEDFSNAIHKWNNLNVKFFDSFTISTSNLLKTNFELNNTLEIFAKQLENNYIFPDPNIFGSLLSMKLKQNTFDIFSESVQEAAISLKDYRIDQINSIVKAINVSSLVNFSNMLSSIYLPIVSNENAVNISEIDDSELISGISDFNNVFSDISARNFEEKIQLKMNEFHLKHPILFTLIIFLLSYMVQTTLDAVLLDKKTIINNYTYNITINGNDGMDNLDDNLIDQSTLLNYRYVNIDELSVHSSCSNKSNVISKLNFDNVVRVDSRHKKWTFIKFKDGEIQCGYVLNKYLRRIVRRY